MIHAHRMFMRRAPRALAAAAIVTVASLGAAPLIAATGADSSATPPPAVATPPPAVEAPAPASNSVSGRPASNSVSGRPASNSVSGRPAPAAEVPAAVDSAAMAAPSPAASGMSGRPVGHRKVRLDQDSRNVVRSGPGAAFAIVGVYPKNAEFPVIAKSGDWYDVRLSATETGWIHASLCREFDDMSDLEFRPNPRLYTRTGTFIAGGYAGAYAFDRKSNSFVLGGRLGYYVFDRLQVEGSLSYTHIYRPAEIVESLFGLSLEAEDFGMLFYNLNTTFEILPGRQMVPFVSGGVGSAIMRGTSEPSFNVGAGTTLYVSKKMATRWEVRDYHFNTGPKASRVANDNVEFSLGTMFLF
ncbi:MAG: outer membrane beta-barrel domain-containing protein [Candidatus Eisenbacteria bacterium]|nr:outer membrane beta-barrel domain-containing protein [Candidatus Eisenbacteria bacterium]